MKNQQRKLKEVTGTDLLGNEREYNFQLLPAGIGLDLFHENMGAFITFGTVIRSYIEDDENEDSIATIAMTCQNLFDPKDFTTIRSTLLKGTDIADPLEAYAAMYHALIANYGATLTPLLDALEEQGDSNQTSSPETSEQPAE